MYYGCDTETYSTPSYGLKSIQIATKGEAWYLTSSDFTQDDKDVRAEICRKFVQFLESIQESSMIFFFNLKFDSSQFLQYLMHVYTYDSAIAARNLPKGGIAVLETDMQVYEVRVRNSYGHRIKMLDIANFLTGTRLNTACKEWIGKEKVELDSKNFPKAPATALEQEYAITDAALTYELGLALLNAGVIEGARVSIAGRTMHHYMAFLKERYNIEFDRWAYMGTKTAEAELKVESEIREGVRGGVCQAVHRGIYEHCHHVDARSMYPTQMVKDRIPLGPLLDEKPLGKYTRIVWPVGWFALNEDTVPYVQWKTQSMADRYRWKDDRKPGEYVNDFFLDGSYPFWEDEWNLILRKYDAIGYSIVKEKYFMMAHNDALQEYVRELYRGKQTSTGSKRQYYKILLNALYGKFLSRPDGWNITYDNGVREKVYNEGRHTYYLPLGSWIAMSGRMSLMHCLDSLPYEAVLYCDTDSCIFQGEEWPDITIGKELGEWGIEKEDVKVNIVGPKTYQEIDKDGLVTRCAGLSIDQASILKFGELKEGLQVPVLKAKRDPDTWAINLRDTMFTVSSDPFLLRRRI